MLRCYDEEVASERDRFHRLHDGATRCLHAVRATLALLFGGYNVSSHCYNALTAIQAAWTFV